MYPGQKSSTSSIDYLLQGCSTYKSEFRSRISKDANDVLGRWGSLKPETDLHYNNDGTSQMLLVLTGTVPIFYCGSQYNIPMCFKITKDYPLTPPLVYVTPTATMQIERNHDYVAPDGKVYLPYLGQWNPSRSNLSGLIETCKAVFSQMPPVHAKKPNSQPPPPTYTSATTAPTPATTSSSSSSSSGASLPYPTAGRTPPPPPYPSGATSSSLRTSTPAGIPPPAVGVQKTSESLRQDAEAKERRELESARQTLEIKLQVEYKRFQERMKQELKEEIATQKKLEEGEKKILDGLGKLTSQDEELRDLIADLETKQVQLEGWLEEYETTNSSTDGSLEQKTLDDAIVPADGPSRQLFDCVSESNAIEDTLYYLDKALSNDIIDLALFLKEVRKLSRKQFMAKALSRKIKKYQLRVEMQSKEQPNLNSRPPAYHSQYRR